MRTGRFQTKSAVRFILSIFVFLSFITNIKHIHAEGSGESKPNYKVSLSGDAGGGGNTIMPDLSTGTMSYAIPIDVPVGRKGMDPGLALSYRSGNGNSWLGVGWDLEVGAIERQTKDGLDYNADKYNLRMNGGMIELVNIAPNEYRAKIEGMFVRVVKKTDANPFYWEVYDKSGVKYTYGKTAYGASAPRQDDPADANRVFRWALDLLQDANGNYMTFSYTEDQDHLYLDRIDYTGHESPSLPTTNYVKFHLETRTDTPVMYTTNFAVATAKRLKTIAVYAKVAGVYTLVRAYKLTYSISESTSMSVLASVQQFGSDANVDGAGNITNESTATKLPATNLQRPAQADGFEIKNSSSLNIHATSPWNLQGDFNGDGREDLLAVYATGFGGIGKVYVNYGTENGLSPIAQPYEGLNIHTDPNWNLLGDFNGDGRTDLLAVYATGWGNGQVYVNYSTGSGFSSALHTGLYIHGNYVWNKVGDFDGDGRTDFLSISGTGWGTGAVYVNYSTGNGFAASPLYTGLDIHTNYPWNQIGDFNGDGKQDLLAVYGTGWGNGQVYVNYSTGSGFSPALHTGLYIHGDYVWYKFGDFNGDGKTDFLSISGTGWGTGAVYVNYSTGDGFAASPLYTGLYIHTNYPWNQVGDFNGDGKQDLLAVYGTGWGNGQVYVNYSTGSGFSPALHTGLYMHGDYVWYKFGDFDGDGRTDFLSISGTGWGTGAVYINSPRRPYDHLAKIENGLGGSTTISYKPSTQFTNTQLPFPVQVVSSVTINNGVTTAATTTYSYTGGYYHVASRDFRGFSQVTVTGPAGPNNERTVTKTWFHQGNDTAVDVNNPDVTEGYMKGKPYKTEVYDGQGNLYSRTTTAYDTVTLASGQYYNPPKTVVTDICDGDACGRQTKVEYTNDANGNVTRIDNYGDTADTNDNSTVVREYDVNTTAWILGLPKREALYKGIQTSTDKMSETLYYYDGTVTDCSSDSGQTMPTKGNVTRIARWLHFSPDADTYLSTRMGYDPYGNLQCTRDPRTYTSTISYDGTSTFPTRNLHLSSGLTTTTVYYGVDSVAMDTGLYGQVKSVTDPNNVATTTEYDKLGRKTKVTAPDGGITTWSYPAVSGSGNVYGSIGNQYNQVSVLQTASPQTWITTKTYFEGFGRTIKTEATGPDGKTIYTVTEYNPTGTVKRSSLPYFTGETVYYTAYQYDPLGRATQVTASDNAVTKACYNDWTTTTVDAKGHAKRQTMNAQGKLKTMEEFSGTYALCNSLGAADATTAYVYDVLGNLTAVTDAAGNQTIINYDSLSRKRNMDDPDMGYWQYTYDANGNLSTQKDAKNQTITFNYDSLNRVVTKVYPVSSQTVTYIYDETWSTNSKGRLTTMIDSSGLSKYQYDAMGRPTITTKIISGATYTTQNAYTVTGAISSIKYPDNEFAKYTYDAGLLKTVAIQPVSGPTVTYATYSGYNALGQSGRIDNANGVYTTYGYAANNKRLTSIVTRTTGTVLSNLTYTYDNVGNVSSITDGLNSARTQTFGYDHLNRLVSAASTTYGNLSYTYDKIGNFVSKEGVGYIEYGRGAGPHAVTKLSTGETFTYDANGNMTNDGTRTITYDYDNMPQSVVISGATTTFVYDGSGKRVKKIASSGTTVYIGKLYECRGGSCSKYIFAGATRIATKPTGTTTGALYYHADHLGSSSIITDSTGTVVEQINYLPFGATRSDTGGVSVSHKYTSQELDPETGLYYYNARYYNPALGRFISADTIVPDYSNPQALNSVLSTS